MFTKLFINLSIAANRFAKDRQGVTAIEYAIIAVAISALVLAVFSGDGALKTALDGAFTKITTNIGNADAAGTGD